jgi:hypothetical protein
VGFAALTHPTRLVPPLSGGTFSALPRKLLIGHDLGVQQLCSWPRDAIWLLRWRSQWRSILAAHRRPSFCAPPPRHQKCRHPAARPQGGGAPKGASIKCPRIAADVAICRRFGRGSGPMSGAARLPALRPRRLPKRPNASTQPGPRFARAGGRGRYPPPIALKRSTPRPGRSAGGDDARTAPARVTKPARRNRTCSASGIVSRSAPRMSKIYTRNINGDVRQEFVSVSGTICFVGGLALTPTFVSSCGDSGASACGARVKRNYTATSRIEAVPSRMTSS